MRSERLKVGASQLTISAFFPASKSKGASPASAIKSKDKRKRIQYKAKDSIERLDSVFLSKLGQSVSIGDDVYMALTDDQDLLPNCEEEEDECCTCHRGITRNSGPMVECERCLGGYHIRCLKPILKAIPQGDWFCPECVAGSQLPTRPPATACEKFIWGDKIVQVARVIDIVKNRQGDGEVEVRVRFFLPPEATRMGRLEHHNAREVFCSTTSYYESVDCIVRKAQVYTLDDFKENAAAGNDIFLCEFSYNEQWHRFIRWGGKRQGVKKSAEVDEESDPLEASSAEEESEESGGEESSSEGQDSEDSPSSDEGSEEGGVSLKVGRKRKPGGGPRPPGKTWKKGKRGGGEGGGMVQRPIYAFWAERGLLKGNLSDRIRKNLDKDKKAREKLLSKSGGKGMAANKLLGGGWGEGATTAAIGGSQGEGLDGHQEGEEGVDATTRYGFEALADSILSKQGASSVAPAGRSSSLDHPERGSGLLGEARRSLSLSAAPRELPCREAEKARISKFVEDLVVKGAESSGVMYICGIPGTGKTACISEVLSRGPLRAKASQAGVQIISINALTLPSPLHIYSKLWERLAGQRCGPSKALSMLEGLFAPHPPGPSQMIPEGTKEGKHFMTLLIVDEIDILMTRDQSVLYNLFEWPTLTGARLSVIGISNTHDLDSRVLPRIASRLASSKLAFQPYNNTQLKDIAMARLRESNAVDHFDAMAIEFVARRVASTSGDVRRVLELLRRALDVAEEEWMMEVSNDKAMGKETERERLTIKKCHVTTAMEEVYSSTHMQFVRQCSLVEKALMVALMLEMRATKKMHASVMALHARIETHLVLLVPDCRCNEGVVLSLCHGLVTKGLLVSSPAWHHLRMRVQFRVDSADIAAGIKEDQRLASIHTLMS